jgi:hypothetical protein
MEPLSLCRRPDKHMPELTHKRGECRHTVCVWLVMEGNRDPDYLVSVKKMQPFIPATPEEISHNQDYQDERGKKEKEKKEKEKKEKDEIKNFNENYYVIRKRLGNIGQYLYPY